MKSSELKNSSDVQWKCLAWIWNTTFECGTCGEECSICTRTVFQKENPTTHFSWTKERTCYLLLRTNFIDGRKTFNDSRACSDDEKFGGPGFRSPTIKGLRVNELSPKNASPCRLRFKLSNQRFSLTSLELIQKFSPLTHCQKMRKWAAQTWHDHSWRFHAGYRGCTWMECIFFWTWTDLLIIKKLK